MIYRLEAGETVIIDGCEFTLCEAVELRSPTHGKFVRCDGRPLGFEAEPLALVSEDVQTLSQSE